MVTNGSQVRQLKVCPIHLQDVASGLSKHLHAKTHSLLENKGRNQDHPGTWLTNQGQLKAGFFWVHPAPRAQQRPHRAQVLAVCFNTGL